MLIKKQINPAFLGAIRILNLITNLRKSKYMTGESGMYFCKTEQAREYVRVKNYSFREYGAPSRQRKKRSRDTPKAMMRYNHQKRVEKIQMLMILNFDRGFHVTLDYPKDGRPATYQEAEKNLMKCLAKTSRRLKKKNIRFKYIAVTERGKRAAALHHHVIIEGLDEVLSELMKSWGYHMKISPMYEDGAYKDLAEYILKHETKEECIGVKYHRSRNLKEPDVRVSVCPGPIKDDPEIPEGYHLVQDSFVNGYNELLDIRYQSYLCKRDEHPKDIPNRPKYIPKRKGVQKGDGFWTKLKRQIFGRGKK